VPLVSPSLPELTHSLWEVISGWLMWAGILLSLSLVPSIIVSRKVPQAKVAWLLAVIGFPWIGSLFYLTFGRRDLRRKVLRLKSSHAPGRASRAVKKLLRRLKLRRTAVEMVGEVERAGALPPIPGNAFTLLAEGPAAFAAGRDAMRAAEHHIHLVTYIFKSDPTGRGTLKLLADAAARGVEVRVLHDGAGTFRTRSRFFDPIRKAGGTVASFLPISPFVPGLRLNLRNHRKLLIVDGEVAFTGGMNIGDEYATGHRWRDVHIGLHGPVVPALQRVFAEDWHLATGETLEGEKYFQQQPEAGSVPVQVVPSGPDQLEPLAPELMFGAIAAAREKIDIVTPYLVPTEAIEQALRSAARRGRRVRILLPQYVDSRVVRWATDSYLPRLLQAGVEVWRHPHMVHGKLVIVDDTWATLGSTNLDMRSLYLNFELNVAIPHDATARLLAEYFEGELASSRRLTLEDLNAPFRTRLARAAANLLSPLL
jgi:cardiolipin synthase